MNKLDSVNAPRKESTVKISHPAIGKIYCLNETRGACDRALDLHRWIVSAGRNFSFYW